MIDDADSDEYVDIHLRTTLPRRLALLARQLQRPTPLKLPASLVVLGLTQEAQAEIQDEDGYESPSTPIGPR